MILPFTKTSRSIFDVKDPKKVHCIYIILLFRYCIGLETISGQESPVQAESRWLVKQKGYGARTLKHNLLRGFPRLRSFLFGRPKTISSATKRSIDVLAPDRCLKIWDHSDRVTLSSEKSGVLRFAIDSGSDV